MRQRRSRRSQSVRYSESTIRERLNWLLQFAERAGQPAAFRGEELERLRNEVRLFPISLMTHGDHQALSARVIAKLAAEVGSAIRALLRDEAWQLSINAIT